MIGRKESMGVTGPHGGGWRFMADTSTRKWERKKKLQKAGLATFMAVGVCGLVVTCNELHG